MALLELEQGCELGPMPCVPPVGLPSVGATFGLTTLAIGYGEAPGFDRRAEATNALLSTTRTAVDERAVVVRRVGPERENPCAVDEGSASDDVRERKGVDAARDGCELKGDDAARAEPGAQKKKGTGGAGGGARAAWRALAQARCGLPS